MLSPSGGWKNPRLRAPAMPFALDNGLYHLPNHPPKGMKALPPFYAMLRRCLLAEMNPMFVVVPDVPYDGDATRILSRKHSRHMRENGYKGPRALAVQDGMTPDDLDSYEAVFVAGSTDWKWRTARGWVDEAKARGMWAHVARVNTRDRIRHCIDIGADSADGTGIWRGDKQQKRGVLEALMETLLAYSEISTVEAPLNARKQGKKDGGA